MSRILLSGFLAACLGGFTVALSSVDDVNGQGAHGTSQTVTKRPLTRAELEARIQEFEPDFSWGSVGGGVFCDVEDAIGNSVDTVCASNRGDTSYWLSAGGGTLRFSFTLVPAFDGSPLRGQRQFFEPTSPTSIVTPFGIPFWGGDATSGPWMLVVRSDNGEFAVCDFDVVP